MKSLPDISKWNLNYKLDKSNMMKGINVKDIPTKFIKYFKHLNINLRKNKAQNIKTSLKHIIDTCSFRIIPI